jgi:glucoamylase
MFHAVMDTEQNAPGWPGIPARWTSAAKSGVGAALSLRSRVWFTISHGILNEIYYPRVDQACTRDFGLIVTDGALFFSEEKRDCSHKVEVVEAGIPAFRLVNSCRNSTYRIEKTIITDPRRDVVLQRICLKSARKDLRLFALLSPHLVNRGAGNTAWIDDYKGVPMLFAEGGGSAMALASSVPWRARSAGFVGVSDGWQDLAHHRELTQEYARAENGNTALVGEIDLSSAADGVFLLALGFGRTASEAALRARSSLFGDFDNALERYVAGWREWQRTLRPLDNIEPHSVHNVYRMSTMVLRCHEASSFAGGIIASLSIPWGFSKGDNDIGGYHLVWPRDLVQTAGALLAADAPADATRVVAYLEAVQEEDGRWPQNMWLDGTPYWSGVQIDECAFPILLVDHAHRLGVMTEEQAVRRWPMVRRAAQFIVENGPVSEQDRWEEDGGYSIYTLAVEVAALLAAADMADRHGTAAEARFLRETADDWNDRIDVWTYARGSPLAARLGIEGYYVRISPHLDGGDAPTDGPVRIKNRPPEGADVPAWSVVSTDALALVRYGLRAADDPRIVNTVKAIDALTRIELPGGPCWHRYNGDGYGEKADGSPFDGAGIGRAWPLLTGERAHFELAAGRMDEAERLLATLESFSSDGSLIPEQVWDAPDIPERELFFGKPSGSAMPLVWAHSEHIKLRRSLADGRVFDTPPQAVERYQRDKTPARFWTWREQIAFKRLRAGLDLRLALPDASVIHWSDDDWATTHDSKTRDSGFRLQICDLPAARLATGRRIVFTFYNPATKQWRGQNFDVTIG